jgi:hypothetical protein
MSVICCQQRGEKTKKNVFGEMFFDDNFSIDQHSKSHLDTRAKITDKLTPESPQSRHFPQCRFFFGLEGGPLL